MKVRSDNGVTEVYFKDFVTVEPKCAQVREAFRAKKADRNKVEAWTLKTFGNSRFNQDFDRVTADADTQPKKLKAWDGWIAAQPMITRKLYYDSSIVAACIMGEDE